MKPKRRLPRSWKAMALEAVVQLAADYSTAASMQEIIARTAHNHPAFEGKAESKAKQAVEELVKEELVLRFWPGHRVELEAEDVMFAEPKEEGEDDDDGGVV
eukprot:23566-Rhodomonas_salina.1